MKISIEFDGVQEGKNYNFQFSLTEDGEVVVKKSSPSKPRKPKEKQGPSLEDFEQKESKAPKIDEPTFKKDTEFKIESSLDGKIDPGKNM